MTQETNSQELPSEAEDSPFFQNFKREAIVESLGLACYIAWSFVFWNGSLLFQTAGVAPGGHLFVVQGALTALGALFLVLSAHKVAPLRRRFLLLGLFALVSSLSVVWAAAVGVNQMPSEWMLFGFALSGLGSTLRLGWEERFSVQGVKRTAIRTGLAYLIGFVIFAGVSFLPSIPALVIAVLLPFGAFLLLVRSVKGEPIVQHHVPLTLQTLVSGIPWKLILAIAIAYFSYGTTRMNGVLGGLEASNAGHVVVAGIPALACLIAIVLAYCFYRRNALLAFYLAFPLMGLATLLPVSLDPFAGNAAFCIALTGAELVKYLVWFLMIQSIMKDGISALMCVALMRIAQWGGSFLGQLAAEALPSPEAVTIAVLFLLVLALLLIMGVSIGGSVGISTRQDKGIHENNLPARVEAAATRFKLSPREQEVLSIWATGHTGAYIEKKLFISKNTVKTHLNHIYAKTKTANREELLELLDSLRS